MVKLYLNFNGSVIPSGKAIIAADNRGFKYGEGLFETIKLSDNKIILGSYHFERLFAGIKQLQFEPPPSFTAEQLAFQILELCKKNNHQRSARIRLMVFRGEGGLYDPKDYFPNYIIQSWPLAEKNNHFNKEGYLISVFGDGRKSCDKFSHLKSNNFLLYVMAALYAKRNRLDDCLILNSYGHVCESTIGNLYCIKDGIIYTPPLTEGCVAGVMRRYLLEQSGGNPICEKPLSIPELMDADELFLSNAIYGIRWIKRFDGREYINTQTMDLYKRVHKPPS
jgi:branched-chain amino acid aminotransferase